MVCGFVGLFGLVGCFVLLVCWLLRVGVGAVIVVGCITDLVSRRWLVTIL